MHQTSNIGSHSAGPVPGLEPWYPRRLDLSWSDVLLFVIGVWSAAGPMTLGLRGVGSEPAAYRHDMLIGVVLAGVAVIRLTTAGPRPPLQATVLVSGFGSALLSIATDRSGDATGWSGTANSIAVGLAAIACATIGAATRHQRRRRFTEQSLGIAR